MLRLNKRTEMCWLNFSYPRLMVTLKRLDSVLSGSESQFAVSKGLEIGFNLHTHGWCRRIFVRSVLFSFLYLLFITKVVYAHFEKSNLLKNISYNSQKIVHNLFLQNKTVNCLVYWIVFLANCNWITWKMFVLLFLNKDFQKSSSKLEPAFKNVSTFSFQPLGKLFPCQWIISLR